jgi:hypothetical protein
MFDFNLMKITGEQTQSGRTLSEALDVAEARRIYLTEEQPHLSFGLVHKTVDFAF